jgi:AP-1 complex subunit beta-1
MIQKFTNYFIGLLQAAKDVVLAEKPTISDDSNQLDPSLLDELLANIATLASVYHKPPESFVSRAKVTAQRPEDDEEYSEGQNSGQNESSAPISETVSTPAVPVASRPPPQKAAIPQPAPLPDLLGDLIGLDNAPVPVTDASTSPAR